ncbi:MAG TPA: alpha-L-fucosidase [Candidatus Merdenecus merdavium]|nr:alpha-L-fucosidase [Candidatus Merdenecus merdavium]
MEQKLERIEAVIRQGPFSESWDSLKDFEVPRWFPKAKFGIFIHWGLYSVAAHNNEWYPRNMYIQDKEEYQYHKEQFGDHKDFGLKDFIPLFTAEKFHPKEWAKIIKDSGANYVFPVAEHHDGFQMYKSEISHYNAAEMGPKRDVLGELKKAFEEEGLHMCTSSHRAEHWFFLSHGKEFDSDVKEPLKRGDFYWPSMKEGDPQDLFSKPYPTKEFLEDWLLRTCEIIDVYEPELLYFDWWVQHQAFKPYLRKVMAYYYNRGAQWGKEVAICYKHDAFAFGSGIPEVERGKFQEPKPFIWQTDTAVAKNSWCYTDTLDYKTPREILCNLVDIVSKNGNMLLNIGPKGDGSIPEGDLAILQTIGQWMKINGEGIYHSKVWRKSSEGPTKEIEGQFTDNQIPQYTSKDFRFTTKGSYIYAFALAYPKDGRLTIQSFAKSKDQNMPEFHGIIMDVKVLGYDKEVCWKVDEEGLHIKTEDFSSDFPVAIKVQIQ